MRLRGNFRLILSVLAVLLFSTAANADLFTFQISGQVNDDAINGCGGLVDCGVLTGSYTFDSTATDQNVDPAAGLYDATDITLSINGVLFFSSAMGLINVTNFPGFDFYGVLAGGIAANGSSADFSMSLFDAFGSSFSSDALPTDSGALAGLLPGSFTLFATDDSFQLQGTIEAVAITAVPEPSSVALLSAVGLTLLFARRRFRGAAHRH